MTHLQSDEMMVQGSASDVAAIYENGLILLAKMTLLGVLSGNRDEKKDARYEMDLC